MMMNKNEFKNVLKDGYGKREVKLLYCMYSFYNDVSKLKEIGYEDWIDDNYDNIKDMNELQKFILFFEMNDGFDGLWLYDLFGGDKVYEEMMNYFRDIEKGKIEIK